MAKPSPLMLAPPLIFGAFVALAAVGMFRENPDDLPSVFVGKQAPALPTEPLPGYPLVKDTDLRDGEITVVNFWASWCPPCRAEHPTLLALAEEGVNVVGVNFKDNAEDATAYLADSGNPFSGTAFDPKGRVSINWGVTAPPETFIIDGDGTVLFKFIGPLVGSDYKQRFRPALVDAMKQ